MARIAVVFTGGTISMRAGAGGDNRPALAGQDLLETVPELVDIAQLDIVDWGLVPGSHLTFEDVLSSPGYGFPGGSTTWWDAGAIFAGTLGGLKSRVALSLATGAALGRDEIVELFAWFGGGAKA